MLAQESQTPCRFVNWRAVISTAVAIHVRNMNRHAIRELQHLSETFNIAVCLRRTNVRNTEAAVLAASCDHVPIG